MDKSMYLTAAESIKNHFPFRPMTLDGEDVLFSETFLVDGEARLDPEGQRLACFAGGRFIFGNRLFER